MNSNSIYMKDLLVNSSVECNLTPKICHTEIYATRIPIADIRLQSARRMTDGTFGNPIVEKIAENSKASLFGKGDTTARDFDYRQGREAVAAGIAVDSAWQSEFVDDGWDGVDNDEGSSGEGTDECEHGAVPGF
jgi:hypothetical protein